MGEGKVEVTEGKAPGAPGSGGPWKMHTTQGPATRMGQARLTGTAGESRGIATALSFIPFLLTTLRFWEQIH